MSEEAEVKSAAAKTALSYRDIKKKKKPVTTRVPIAMDGEAADEFNEAVVALANLKEEAAERPRDKELALKIDEAQAKVDELRSEVDVVEFVFRSIGRRQFEQLLVDCPPTKAQIQEAEKKGEDEPGWNPDTFPPTIIASALIEPEMSEEDVFDIWDSNDWNQAELVALFLAALSVNQQRKIVDLGKGSGLTTD